MAKKKTSKPQRPSRDDFELEELAYILNEAKEDKREVVMTLWQKEPVQGQITKLDGQTKLIHIERLGDTRKIPFVDILKIDSVGN